METSMVEPSTTLHEFANCLQCKTADAAQEPKLKVGKGMQLRDKAKFNSWQKSE